MKQANKLLNKALYLIPRLILLAVIMFSLAITLIISVDFLAVFRPPLNELRQSLMVMLGW